MNNIDSDGQYTLRVNTDSIYFYKEGRQRLLSIITDHPDGWLLEIDGTGMPWVHEKDGKLAGAQNSRDSIYIGCDVYTPGSPLETHREGYITIKAGRIRKNIKIYQADEPELTIEVTPTLITFRKSGSTPKSVTVKVYPESSDVYFDPYQPPGTSPVSWVPTTGFPESGYPWLSPGIYSFQPLVNDSDPAKTLSTVVNISIVDADGYSKTGQVTIRQLADDLLFDYKPTTPFPAAGGSATLYIDSDTDWWVYGKEDADGVIATWHDTRHEPGTNTPYLFSISPNNSWSPRSGKLSVMSTDDDFVGDHITVNQAAPVTSLVTVPANGQTIAFGNAASPGAQSVSVTSNAQWTMTSGGNFANVATASATSGGAHTYNSKSTNSVTFTPSSWGAAGTTPAAGTVQSTTATFTTSNHSPAGASSSQLTLTRTVPAIFSYTSFARTNGDYKAKEVTVKANTNASFYARTITGSKTTNGTAVAASAWGAKTASVTVPANNTWDKAESNIYYVYNGTQSASLGTVTQTAGYIISKATRTLVTNTASSATFTVRLTGRWPSAISVRAATGGTNETNRTAISGASGTVPKQNGAETNVNVDTSQEVKVGANETGKSRVVYIQYNHPSSGWKDIASFTQAAIVYGVTATTTLKTDQTADPKDKTITFTGAWKEPFEFAVGWTLSSYFPGSSSLNNLRKVTVPACPTGGTYVYTISGYSTYDYKFNGGATWIYTLKAYYWFYNPVTGKEEMIVRTGSTASAQYGTNAQGAMHVKYPSGYTRTGP